MADFIQSFPFFDIESLNQFSGSNMENLAFNYQTLLPNSSIHVDSLENHLPPGNFVHNNHPSLVSSVSQSIFTPKTEAETPEISKKRKTLDVSQATSFKSSSSSLSSSPQVSETGGMMIKRKTKSGRGKRAKMDDNEVEKPKDVVHVRARRGQATDSHSLAERVRRGKINERLRCLQDIVPGCYKTMGMAVMLDEIINYVQSLQNQVEFLSMKLTAASTYYDFNSESNAMERMQAQEAKELERLMGEGGYVGVGGLACFHSSSSSTWSSLS